MRISWSISYFQKVKCMFFFFSLSCRWNIWEMSASASKRHIQIWHFTSCSSAPKDHPGEALTQRYSKNPGLRVSCTEDYNYFMLLLWWHLQKLLSTVCSRPSGADFIKVKSLLTHWICNEGLMKPFRRGASSLSSAYLWLMLYTIKSWHPWMLVSYK